MIKAFVYGAIVTGISIGAGMIGYSEYINGLDKDYKYLGVRQQFLYFLDQLSVEDIIELRKSRINNPWL